MGWPVQAVALWLVDVLPTMRLALATVLLGVPGRVLADGTSDARYLGIAAIVAAFFSGIATLVAAVATAVAKIRASGPPSAAQVAYAEEILRRRDEAAA